MASRSLNRVILIGNLTRDPELKYTPAGTAVCTFGIATNRSWTTADGQTKDEAQYHRIVAWQKLAELCGKLLTKGRKVYLEGRLVYRTFTGRDGQQRTIAEIVLDDFIVFGDGKRMASEEKSESEIQESPTERAEEEIPSVGNISSKNKPADDQPLDKKKEEINPDDIPF
ncbi:MAG: Single-stranded DNA-binding protein [Candidatus Roizmanbacteria bacterium GW2011_GWA2_36_23]|uniref:Single-stranded DNA-binding protein n=1 Tax=Candidatus Roizmanbacteria bacterium GW2011_GWA2_36_23 TaxID=1618480 RepID=A0A0G0E4G6_9BACT|nr:MAG: Single-stranded DNA-binding protein [Candidatus Roizmanbacteria bacterium GW2011_GWA2_36_23]